jgi:hypothetical protein
MLESSTLAYCGKVCIAGRERFISFVSDADIFNVASRPLQEKKVFWVKRIKTFVFLTYSATK